jgi:hypothetical protein
MELCLKRAELGFKCFTWNICNNHITAEDTPSVAAQLPPLSLFGKGEWAI